MAKGFWLGIIGGILGILAALLVVLIGGVGEAFQATGASSLYANAAGAFIFSIVGMAGGVLEKRKMIAAALDDYRSFRRLDIDFALRGLDLYTLLDRRHRDSHAEEGSCSPNCRTKRVIT